jgi:sec-independent protein translocase protein TatA
MTVMAGLTGWHLLILLAVVVLLFGAKRLPDMARAVGQSARILKGEMKGTEADERARSHQRAPATAAHLEQSAHSVIPAQAPDTTHPPTR